MESAMIRMNPRQDVSALAQRFREEGRVHIPEFLHADDAKALYEKLRYRTDWVQVLATTNGAVELDRPTRAQLDENQVKALNEAVYAQARSGFQYRFETARVPDSVSERAANSDIISRFAEFMSTDRVRDFLRMITGSGEIEYADAQATAYAPGDFLTGHDDDVQGKFRRAAYVFGLTPIWRLEWGGLLLFHGSDGHVDRGLAPTFNTLNLFKVPQLHSVSEVTQAAAYRRYAITGWLRAEKQPD
jgi:Rps23 Pro-64 3,4-dihydroxylase Tpa1-like proline 4-hydroxylase